MFRFFCTFLLMLITLWSNAQHVHFGQMNNEYMTKFDRFDKETGLSDNLCTKIYQDRYGYIWVGTANGLNRFDGYEFIHLTHDEVDTTTLSDNFISDITEDRFGNLWIATHNGLNQYDRLNGQFIRWEKTETKNSIRDNHVRAILADSNFLWIETLDGTLSKLDIKNKKFSHYKHQAITQPYYNYHALFKDSEGAIWAGGRNLGPIKFNPENETFAYIENGDIDEGKKRDLDVASFFIDNQNTFWISATDGIYTYDKKNNYFQSFLGTSTYSIIQDDHGDIWFGSGSGVYRFNYNNQLLVHYINDENNPHSLSNNHVNQIFEDKDGNIWVATDNGLNKTSLQKNIFGHFYHIPGNKNSLSSNQVATLTVDSEDNLWIGYENKGFDYYQIETGLIKHFRQKDYPTMKSDRVSKLYFDRNNQLWLGLWQGVGFSKYNPLKGNFSHYAFDPDTRKRDWYNDFLEDQNGNFWVGMWGSNGLHLFNRKTEKFEPDHFRPSNAPLINTITALANDSDNLWIGSNNRFIYRYHFKTGRFFAYTNGERTYSEFEKIRFKNIFDFKEVYKIIIDSLNRKWVITDKGIISIQSEQNKFIAFPVEKDQKIQFINNSPDQQNVWLLINNQLNHFNFRKQAYENINIKKIKAEKIKFVYDWNNLSYLITNHEILQWDQKLEEIITTDSFKDDIIQKVFYDQSNNLWLFTENNILIYDQDLKKVNFDYNISTLKNADINNVFEDLDSTLYVATNNGLFKINPSRNKIENICTEVNNDIISNQIKAITTDKYNNLWIGTIKGLCKYNANQHTFEAFNKPGEQSLTSHLVNNLYEDKQGNIWVGTTNAGLNCLNPRTGIINHFMHNNEDSTTLSSNDIQCIFQDTKDRIWVGTDNGLNLLEQNAKKFKRFNKKNGLPSNMITAIIEDHSNNLWIATDNGFCKFNPEKEIFENYYKQDGLQSNKFTNAVAKLKTGRLVFGGENGINIFHPDDIEINYRDLEVQITNFKIFNDNYKTDFTNTNDINLNYKENFFTISFSALNFYNPQHFSYKYKLKGIDPKWVKVKNTYSTVYTDISPGNYTFEVMAIAPDGTESNTKTLNINIKPPFWQTWWFFVLIGIIKFSIIGWIIYLRFRKYKAEKENIKLEQKLLRSQMNPHFIFNALFSIQNFLYAHRNEEADRYLTKFSRLLRLTLENSREAQITIENEIQTIRNYLDLQKLRFDEKFSYNIIVDSKINKEEVLIPPMLAQPFIENAIEHGFYEKDKSYDLNIGLWLVDKNIIYTIEDNGIGIKKSKELNKKNKKDHKSLGMQISNERIINYKKITKQNIRIQVIDLTKGNKSGTRVIFTIPVNIRD